MASLRKKGSVVPRTMPMAESTAPSRSTIVTSRWREARTAASGTRPCADRVAGREAEQTTAEPVARYFFVAGGSGTVVEPMS